jgi:hypothetical protein
MIAAMSAAPRVSPPWGGPLSDGDYVTLDASWITLEIADAAMLRRGDAQKGRDIVGQRGQRGCAGLLIPCYWLGEIYPHSYRKAITHAVAISLGIDVEAKR